MAKPADGSYVISTRTEEELRRAKQRWTTGSLAVAVALGAAGAVLLVLGLLL